MKTSVATDIVSSAASYRRSYFQTPFSIFRIAAVMTLAGCAGVTVTPLTQSGTAKPGAKEGMRYYMPAPYLLVTRMPPVPSPHSASTTEQSANSTDDEVNAAKSAKPTATPSKSKDDGAEPSSAPAGGAPSSNTSFLASTPEYMLKLIYLPDQAKPMAVSVRTGLFGTASMKPGLQDGWMLTSLDASADSKTAETLTAIASLVSSASTAGAAPAAKAATQKKKGGTTNLLSPEAIEDFSDQVLRPGLYKFDYNDDGELVGMHAVTYFTENGVIRGDIARAFGISGK